MWLFFFKQKTAYEMRISDWSSDVCSSDLDDIGDCCRSTTFQNVVERLQLVMWSYDDISSKERNDMHVRTMQDLGAAVRQARTGHGKTQAELAEHVGVSRDGVVRLAKGHPRLERSEERRVGTEGARTCKYRGWPDH